MAAVDPSIIAKKNHERYVRARDKGHTDYMARAKRYDGFYTGEAQWDPAVKAKLEKEGRPALTFNKILAVINTAMGDQLRRNLQASFKPRRNASREVAKVLNKLAMQVLHANQYKYTEMQVMADGIIQDRGYFDVRMDFSDHLQGEVEITSLDPLHVVLDPDGCEYDPNTWNEVIVTRWMSLDEIEGKYGKAKADELRNRASEGALQSYDTVHFERENTFGAEANGIDRSVVYSDGTDSRDIRTVRVVERQHYQWTMERMFVDPESGDMAEVPSGWSDKRMKAFAAKNNLTLHKRNGRRVRWTVSADHVLLYDDWSLYRTFTVVPFFPYFRRGKPFGMVANLVDPQEHLNKSRSQELHIVNTTANSGWMVEEGTLTNMTADDLEARGAETGLVLEFARGANAPQKISPNTVPTGLDRISEKADIAIREISGVNDGMLGFTAPTVSGVALDRKTTQGQVQLEVPSTHLERSRTMVVRKILELVQDFYTEERAVTITFDHNPMQDEETVLINTLDAAGTLINDVTAGEYEVVISTTPARENYDEGQFADLLDMRMNGIAIPDPIIIRHSNLANRDEIADEVEKLLGQAEPSEQELELMQVQQQLQIQTVQAELQKLQAQAENLQTSSALNMAKASQLAGGNDSPELQFQRDQLESQIRLKREELATRVQLAQLTHQAHSRADQLRTAAQLAATRFQGEVQMQTAHRKVANDKAPKKRPQE